MKALDAGIQEFDRCSIGILQMESFALDAGWNFSLLCFRRSPQNIPVF